jgi:hypothetical protein
MIFGGGVRFGVSRSIFPARNRFITNGSFVVIKPLINKPQID